MSVSGKTCKEYKWDGHCKWAHEENRCDELGSGWKYTGNWSTGSVGGKNCFWYKMNECYREYPCPTPKPTTRPTPAPVNPLAQRLNGEDWVTIYNCDGAEDVRRYLYTDWQGLAQRASAVRICTHGSETECVQSSGIALSNLKSGHLSLQKKGLNWCDTACVKKEWSGDETRLGQLWWKCGRPDDNMFWHACGNTEGLHLDNDEGDEESPKGSQCAWDWEESDNIDVQLLIEPTTAPTSMPSPSPTEAPTPAPTKAPTRGPSPQPTAKPTSAPSMTPTFVPTMAPTTNPTSTPTTAEPSQTPTVTPTFSPTGGPTTPSPTFEPMSYEEYQALCELSNETKELCQAHACKYKKKNTKKNREASCMAMSAKKTKCFKIRDEEICLRMGCKLNQSRGCMGKPKNLLED